MSYNDNGITEIQSALMAGLVIGESRTPGKDGAPYVVIPDGAKVESLEHLLAAPVKIDRSVTLHDPSSFTMYVNRFREPGTTVFFNQDRNTFTAILDYHEGGYAPSPEDEEPAVALAAPSPRWCAHVAKYTPKPTPEWTAWLGLNGRPTEQVAFAQFIENHAGDVADSQGGTLLSVALTMQLKKDVWFTSHQTLENGSSKLLFEEEIKGTAAGGQLTIPSVFALEIRPYVGGAKYRVDCRLRYRLQDRTARFWVEIVLLDKVVEAAMLRIKEDITAQTGLTVLAGE